MGDRLQTELNALLDAALQLPAEQRLVWVESLGAAFEAHKPRLRALLARLPRTDSEPALHTLPKLAQSSPDRPSQIHGQPREGLRVGEYRLLRRLGSGGMAVVWLATDDTGAAGSERLVALKFAHVAAQRPDLRARLGRERDLLAALEHPNIARLYDAGVSEDDRPYLVLEYVQGAPIDEHCAAHRLGLARRLALFVQVADAVAHAHQRRIVHRDLKPSNVLVTAAGEVRLLDFGVAKLLGDEQGPLELQLTRASGRPLTPEYASPEQLSGAEVGFPSDVYSLGVMLYELCTGVRPHAGARASQRELRAAILDQVPPAPSQAATDTASQALLRGALDELILRVLEKQPELRPTIHELAASIEHHARRLSRTS
jgi:eukaryotic-like serine/threonine-protein kinase